MSESGQGGEEAARGETRGGAVLRRLHRARWTVAASAAAIGVATFLSGGSPLLAAALVLAVAAVAALAPQGAAAARTAAREQAGRTAVDRLSALSLSEAVGDPLIVLDASGTMVHANRSARETFGPALKGVDAMLRFRAPEMQALVRRLLDGDAGAIDYVERLPLERLHRVTATPVGGGTGLYVLVFKDQSEARRIDRMRADFIANASHELRTPLASIAGFVETLRGPARDDAAARERFLGIMQDQTSRMARLIDDLLSLSRLEMKPFVEPGLAVDIVRVVGSVADALSQMAAEAGVVVERNLPSVPVEVAGSGDELTQVFANLLENAIKYGQAGGRVVLSLERGADGPRPEVAVTVRDFGPGIPAEHIPRVTERFYRVDVETGRAPKGTGLGLSIVKHILTRHGARLTIRSEPGQGAAFTVHLPAA